MGVTNHLLAGMILQVPQFNNISRHIPFKKDKDITDCFQIQIQTYIGCGSLPVTVTARIITCLVRDSCKPSLAFIGRGTHPNTHSNAQSPTRIINTSHTSQLVTSLQHLHLHIVDETKCYLKLESSIVVLVLHFWMFWALRKTHWDMTQWIITHTY